MKTQKFKKRISNIPDDMPIVVSFKGHLHQILTAKIFRNQTRVGADEYFCIVATEEMKKKS